MYSPQALVSSPLEEEDISRATFLHEGTESDARDGLAGQRGKQKQRARDPFNENEDDESSEDEAEPSAKSYPPTNDAAAEAQRVQEVRRLTPRSGLS